MRNDPVSTYNAGLRGSFLSILIVSCKLLARNSDNGKPIYSASLASFQIYTAISLAVIQILFPRRPDLFTPEGNPVDLERSCSAFNRYSMQWCKTALALAGKPVPLDQLPVLDYFTRSKTQPLLVLTSPKTTLWDRILAERYFGFAKQWILMFVRSIVTFGSPYCVMRLLKSLEYNHGRTGDAWIWLIGIGVSSVCQTIINYHLIWIQWSEMGIPLRAQLIMAIFQKALRRKDSKDQNKSSDSKVSSDRPEAINLISSDTVSLSKFTAVNYIIPSSFVRFFFAVLFLLKGLTLTLKNPCSSTDQILSLRSPVGGTYRHLSARRDQAFALEIHCEQHKRSLGCCSSIHSCRGIDMHLRISSRGYQSIHHVSND